MVRNGNGVDVGSVVRSWDGSRGAIRFPGAKRRGRGGRPGRGLCGSSVDPGFVFRSQDRPRRGLRPPPDPATRILLAVGVYLTFRWLAGPMRSYEGLALVGGAVLAGYGLFLAHAWIAAWRWSRWVRAPYRLR